MVQKFHAETIGYKIYSSAVDLYAEPDACFRFIRDECRKIEEEAVRQAQSYFDASTCDEESATLLSRDDQAFGTVGEYRLLALLGHGAQGSVFLAEHPKKPNKKYAVKIHKPNLGESHHQLSVRIEKEIQIAREVADRVLAHVIDYGVDETCALGSCFYVMNYVEGENLEVKLRKVRLQGRVRQTRFFDTTTHFRSRFSKRLLDPAWRKKCVSTALKGFRVRGLETKDALRWMGDVAVALRTLHEKGIRHRDIKPSNIMVNENQNEAVLTDFGLATDGRAFPGGTYRFMAPEHVAGNSQSYDYTTAASDVYSFGLVLYRLLTGSYYTGESIELSSIIKEPELARVVAQLIRRCCRFRPRDRYQDGRALFEAYRPILNHINGTASLPDPDGPIREEINNIETNFFKNLFRRTWEPAFGNLIALCDLRGTDLSLTQLLSLKQRAMPKLYLEQARRLLNIELDAGMEQRFSELANDLKGMRLEGKIKHLEEMVASIKMANVFDANSLVLSLALVLHLQAVSGPIGRLLYLKSQIFAVGQRIDDVSKGKGSRLRAGHHVDFLIDAAEKNNVSAVIDLQKMAQARLLLPDQIERIRSLESVDVFFPMSPWKIFGLAGGIVGCVLLAFGLIRFEEERRIRQGMTLEIQTELDKGETGYDKAWEIQKKLFLREFESVFVMKDVIDDKFVNRDKTAQQYRLELEGSQQLINAIRRFFSQIEGYIEIGDLGAATDRRDSFEETLQTYSELGRPVKDLADSMNVRYQNRLRVLVKNKEVKNAETAHYIETLMGMGEVFGREPSLSYVLELAKQYKDQTVALDKKQNDFLAEWSEGMARSVASLEQLKSQSLILKAEKEALEASWEQLYTCWQKVLPTPWVQPSPGEVISAVFVLADEHQNQQKLLNQKVDELLVAGTEVDFLVLEKGQLETRLRTAQTELTILNQEAKALRGAMCHGLAHAFIRTQIELVRWFQVFPIQPIEGVDEVQGLPVRVFDSQ